MSHFSTCKTQVRNIQLAREVCSKMGWTMTLEEEHVNGWSQEKLTNVWVIRDGNGKVKGCVDQAGNVIHDSYYMGREINGYLQQYAATHLKNQAALDGGMVMSETINQRGELELVLQYA